MSLFTKFILNTIFIFYLNIINPMLLFANDLISATDKEDFETVKYLVNHGANINQKNQQVFRLY